MKKQLVVGVALLTLIGAGQAQTNPGTVIGLILKTETNPFLSR